MDTVQLNKLIAVFMGAEHRPQDRRYNEHLYFDGKCAPPVNYIDANRKWAKKQEEYIIALSDLDNLQYHTSWDWLRPVIERVATCRLAYPEEAAKVCDMHITVNIDAAWEKIVQFITWYNTNP